MYSRLGNIHVALLSEAFMCTLRLVGTSLFASFVVGTTKETLYAMGDSKKTTRSIRGNHEYPQP